MSKNVYIYRERGRHFIRRGILYFMKFDFFNIQYVVILQIPIKAWENFPIPLSLPFKIWTKNGRHGPLWKHFIWCMRIPNAILSFTLAAFVESMGFAPRSNYDTWNVSHCTRGKRWKEHMMSRFLGIWYDVKKFWDKLICTFIYQ